MSIPRLAAATAVVTLVLMTVGGAVHATGSSLACPDWPLCYGQVFPEMVGGVAWEHTHRLLGTLVGILTVVLGVQFYRRRRGRSRWLGPLAVAMVVVQGVLGGLTVIYRLPTAVSTAHLATSLAFVSLLVYLGTSSRGVERSRVAPGARLAIDLAIGAVYLQAVLGGLVRHTGAAMACGDDPLLCMGTIHPPTQAAALHLSHRLAALVVAAAVLVAAAWVGRQPGATRSLRGLAVGAGVLVLAQIALGVASVVTHLGVASVSAHLLGAALLLVTLLSMRMRTSAAVPEARSRGHASVAAT